MSIYHSPLRYPGGKARLVPFIKKLYEENNIVGGNYYEPYCGGASVALDLLYSEFAWNVHINDLDLAIYAFWYSAIHDTENICRLVFDVPVTIDEWHRQKRVLMNKNEYPLIDVALATFFLNRTNRSGIITAGVIGGQNQDGKWKIDARFNKKDLLQRLYKIGLYSSRISISNLDACDFINCTAKKAPDDSLFYLDPPYYVKGAQLYQNHYSHEDHVKIAELIKALPKKWIVSYDRVPEILDIYAEQSNHQYRISYSAANRYRGEEVMFFADGVVVPSSFARI